MTLSAIVIGPVAVVAIVAIPFLIKKKIYREEIHTGRKPLNAFSKTMASVATMATAPLNYASD
tara:strand:- start:291 stop:479 length:189 start_codon:yes stop_codon:yes gene_type:complete